MFVTNTYLQEVRHEVLQRAIHCHPWANLLPHAALHNVLRNVLREWLSENTQNATLRRTAGGNGELHFAREDHMPCKTTSFAGLPSRTPSHIEANRGQRVFSGLTH